MKMLNIQDQLVTQIQEGGQARERALEQLYKSDIFQKKIPAVLGRLNVQLTDVEDINCDTLIAVDKNIRNDKFKGKSSLGTYCVQIAKFKAYNHFRKTGKMTLTDEDWRLETPLEVKGDTEQIKEMMKKQYEILLNQCTEHEQKALKLYCLQYKMREIGAQLDIKEQSAKTLIYRTVKKLRAYIREHPDNFNRTTQ